jgi:hypothetical protein
MSFFLSFTQSKNKRIEQVLPGGLVPVGGERMWRKGIEGEYGANTVYTCMQMEK